MADELTTPPDQDDTVRAIDTTNLNRDLIRQVIQRLRDHPEAHDQTEWFHSAPECGTVACVAGHALFLSGGTLAFEDRYTDSDMKYTVAVVTMPDGRVVTDGGFMEDGERIFDVARNLLGLSEDDALSIFFDTGDADHMIWRLSNLLGVDANDVPAPAGWRPARRKQTRS